MDTSPRVDRPRTNADPAEVRRKMALLGEPHVKPLNNLVRCLRAERGGDNSIPFIDPTCAGTEARILVLVEAPGPAASAARKGSGFLSPDNNDGSAANVWRVMQALGMDRRKEMVPWNAIPWYIGDGTKIRPATDSDFREARGALRRFLQLVPNLRVVLLLGDAAEKAWHAEAADIALPTVKGPHPSPKRINTDPKAWGELVAAFSSARRIAGYAKSAEEPTEGLPRVSPRPRTGGAAAARQGETRRTGAKEPPWESYGIHPRSDNSRAIVASLLKAGWPEKRISRNNRGPGDNTRPYFGGSWQVACVVWEEEAKLAGEFDAFEPTPEDVLQLRERGLRWERIAARVFGDARKKVDVEHLYDRAKGHGASKRSYAGRGRRFPAMNP